MIQRLLTPSSILELTMYQRALDEDTLRIQYFPLKQGRLPKVAQANKIHTQLNEGCFVSVCQQIRQVGVFG